MPLGGIPVERYFGRGRLEQMHARLQAVAATVGLTMRRRDVIINSRRALGAAEFARENGRFAEMHHALFKAHWEGTARLEVVDDLCHVGGSVGLDPDDLRRSIEGGVYERVIDENRRLAESAGIDAIPAHIFGRRYLVVGAQPYEMFTQLLDRLAEQPN